MNIKCDAIFFIISALKNGYIWKKKTVAISILDYTDRGFFMTTRHTWRCLLCNLNLGDSNPRQLCGKTRCTNSGVDMTSDGEEEFPENLTLDQVVPTQGTTYDEGNLRLRRAGSVGSISP